MLMPSMFVFTAGNPEAQQQLAVSIEQPIDEGLVFGSFPGSQRGELERVREEGNGFYAWGVVPGPMNSRTWEAMGRNDYVLCVYGGAYRYVARVVATYDNEQLARNVWGTAEEDPAPRLMYFLTEPQRIHRRVSELGAQLHSAYFGFTRISDEKTRAVAAAHGSVRRFVDFLAGPDAASLMKKAAEEGIAPDEERVLRRISPRFTPVSETVKEFVASYLQHNSPSTILDAWGSAGGWTASLAGTLKPKTAVGLVRDPLERRVLEFHNRGADIDWRLGEPFSLLDDVEGRFDVVLGAPPLNMKPVITLALDTGEGSDQVRIRDHTSNLLVLKAASLISSEGTGFFIVPSTFTRRRVDSVFANLGRLRLHIDAVLGVPGAASMNGRSLPAYLLVVRREPPERLFVGELVADGQSRDTLLGNLKNRKSGRLPQLGLLVDPQTSLSLQALYLEQEVELHARRFGYPPAELADLATEMRFLRPGKGEFEDVPNAVYMPLAGRSPAVTAVADLASRPHDYVQVVLDPDRAEAGYVASFLNNSLGQKLREYWSACSSAARITRAQVESARVYLPDMQRQAEILEVQTSITTLMTQLQTYQAQLWNRPKTAAEVARAVNAMRRQEDLRTWIETLPFPLASILWAYRADNLPQNRRDHLLHFFEALSQFNATLLLSAYCSDRNFYAEQAENWLEKEPKYERWFARSTFGGWNRLCERLAKTTRTLLSNKETRNKCLEIFGHPEADFLDMLTSKKLYALLRAVEEKRNNWKGHSGIVSAETVQKQVRLLEEHLSEVREIIADRYDTSWVLSPGKCEFDAGIYRYDAKQIKGPTTPFVGTNVDVLVPMEASKLYMLHQNQHQPVQLLPFFRLMESPNTQQNACYFYNRLSGAEDVRWVSYHFSTEAEVYRPDQELRSALALLDK